MGVAVTITRRRPPHPTAGPAPSPLRPWSLAALVAGAAAAYALVGLFRHWHFGTSYDLAIFDQAVWHLSRFETPASTLSGHANILGDHFSPILVLFAPFYWVAPRPETLIIAQAALLSASIVPVFLFARDRLPEPAALAMATAYALFWGMQRTAFTDVHELAFAPVLVAGGILAIDRRRWRLLWIVSLLLMLVKEDLIAVAASFGAYTFVASGERRRGAWLSGVACLAFVLVLRVAIPWFNGGAEWSTGHAFDAFWQRPWAAPLLLFTPPAKANTIAMWLAPFLFLPLASPLALLLIPIGAERLLSAQVAHWSIGAHYSAPLAPILAMAAADGLARIARRVTSVRGRVITATALASLVAAAVLPGHQPLWLLFQAREYRTNRAQAAAARAMAAIPTTASVVAQAAVAPHLSERDRIYVLQPGAPDADYVIASGDLAPWPSDTPDDIRQLLNERRARGYVTIFDDDGWTVLRR